MDTYLCPFYRLIEYKIYHPVNGQYHLPYDGQSVLSHNAELAEFVAPFAFILQSIGVLLTSIFIPNPLSIIPTSIEISFNHYIIYTKLYIYKLLVFNVKIRKKLNKIYIINTL